MVLVGAILLIGSVAYSVTRLSPLEQQIAAKEATVRELALMHQRGKEEIDQLQAKNAQLARAIQESESTLKSLREQVGALRATQSELLDFLARVADSRQISILDPDINWAYVKSEILNLPNGKRKQAVLTAILIAWKEVPFSMGGQSVKAGFDSPRFLRYVLASTGLDIKDRHGEPLSATMMKSFQTVPKPRPGDLVFYKGQVGSFGLMYLSDGGPSGNPVGVGTLQAAAPLQILGLKKIRTDNFPMIGFFRVVYPDEK